MVSANLPEEAFPSHTLRTATGYFKALVIQHLSLLLDHEQHEMNKLVKIKMGRCNENKESFG
jgi:hypothetical protein